MIPRKKESIPVLVVQGTLLRTVLHEHEVVIDCLPHPPEHANALEALHVIRLSLLLEELIPRLGIVDL
eukprot:54997-Eustigmatos_ZCMA.PRE.1